MALASFDICIPTWNSLDYLKLAVKSIESNSFLNHKILIHDNASTDGTGDWIEEHGIFYTQSKTNEGFCGVNHCLKRVESDHVMIFNSDMYALPGWDLEILKAMNAFKRKSIKEYTISSCLVEPTGHNPEYDIENFGADAKNFDEKQILRTFKEMRSRYYRRKDTVQYSHPILMPTAMMKRMGYLDPEYFPGWAVDHDIAARAYYNAGCRNFVMLGKSRVYHFSSATFKQLPEKLRNRHCEDLFQGKWNQPVHAFRQMIGVTRPYDLP
jgi:GT2 family glycosyltransferase